MKIKRSIATVGILLLAVVLPLMVACEYSPPGSHPKGYLGEITITFFLDSGKPNSVPPYEDIIIDLEALKDKDGNMPDVLVPRHEDPTKAGYNFEGWYTSRGDEGELYDFDKPIERQYNAEKGDWYYRGFSLYARWSIDITFDTKPLLDAVKGRHYNDTVGDMLYINEALLGEIESVKFDVDRSKGSLFGSWEVDGGGLGMYAIGFGDDGSFGTDYPLFQSVPIGVYNFEVEVEIRGLSVYSQAHYSITLKQTFSIRVVDPE